MDKLMGEAALVTGALQGIGEEITRIFTRHGANLVLLDISPEIRKLAGELYGRDHRCTAVTANVHDPASITTIIERAKEKEGCIDILVNNAGVCRLGNFLDTGDDDRDFHIDIDIGGVWNVTKAVLPKMIAHKDGRIVMISSITDDMAASPGEMAYALTKATIIGLTKSLAVEYTQSGIRINTICPGYVHTPAAESIVRQSDPEDPELVLTEMTKAVPMRRLADPLEAGELAAFPTPDESDYLVGTQDVTDGGGTLPEAVSASI